MPHSRFLRVAPSAALLALCLPAVASASFVDVSGPSPYEQTPRSHAFFDAEQGETNNVTITRSGDSIVFTDPGSTIQAGSGCTVSGDGHTATCAPDSGAPFDSASARLLDGNDTLSCDVTAPFDGQNFSVSVGGGDGDDTITGCDIATPADTQTRFFSGDFLQGGTGNDTLRGRNGDDVLRDIDFSQFDPTAGFQQGGDDHFFGGAGRDSLNAGIGNDEVRGEDGDDSIFDESGDGTDTYDGGGGLDSISYAFEDAFDDNGDEIPIAADRAGVTINLEGTTTGNGFAGDNDTLLGLEDAYGSQGADNITGSSVGNVLLGNAGNDVITGGGGSDNINGGTGDDTINAQDGATDRVGCGGGNDKANVDNIDQVSSDCDPSQTTVVNVPPPPGPVIIRDPKDTTKAVISQASTPKKVKYRVLRKTGRYRFKIKWNEVVTAENTLSAKLGSRGRIATAGYLTLAEKRVTFAANKLTTVTLTIPKNTRKALRKGKTIRLLINARDAGNNITSRRVTIKLT